MNIPVAKETDHIISPNKHEIEVFKKHVFKRIRIFPLISVFAHPLLYIAQPSKSEQQHRS